MPRLKTYSLGNNGFVRPEVIAALGLPPRARQASVLVVARSKNAAMELLESVGVRAPSRSDPDFGATGGSTVDALDGAGLLDEPAVFATPLTGAGVDDVVVRIQIGGKPEYLGILRRVAGSTLFSREEQAR